MAYLGYLILLSVAAAAIVTADDACPPKADIAPCTCDGEGLSCLGPVSEDQIRKAFKAKFKYGGVRAIWIQATPITKFPSDLLNGIKVQEAYVEMTNATSVDLKAFNGAKSNLFVLSLYGNKLTSFDYDHLSYFDILNTLNLGNNLLTSIPNNGFRSSAIRTLILAQNKISSIGVNAFTGLENIVNLELSQNEITTLGPSSMELKAYYPQINLNLNQISSVSETAFRGTTPQILRLAANKLTSLPYGSFGELVVRMGQNQGLIDASANPFTCKGCDYKWVANNKAALLRVVFGLTCPHGGGLDTITHQNINC